MGSNVISDGNVNAIVVGIWAVSSRCHQWLKVGLSSGMLSGFSMGLPYGVVIWVLIGLAAGVVI
jgi:hypothetical protein